MRKKENSAMSPRMLSVEEVCAYLGLGKNRGVEFAKSIGAERKVGRRCLYDKKVIDAALDSMTA